MKNKSNLAQFFTPPHIARMMSDLCKNTGRFLEPACGNGILTETLTDTGQRGYREGVSIELDPTVAPDYAEIGDFFSYPVNSKNTFGTIISNPPYLSYKSIPESTRNLPVFKMLQAKLGGLLNLYQAFILKSFLHLESHGEMIFIIPDSYFLSTSSFKLNEFLHKNGTFTDVVKFVKTPFKEVTQDVLIFRYERDNMTHETEVKTL